MQGSLFPDVPPVVSKEGKLPPWRGNTPLTREASYSGAKAVEDKAPIQADRIVGWLRIMGPQTRYQIADGLGLLVQSVCGRLKTLQEDGRIQEAGSVKGPYGARNVTYRAI